MSELARACKSTTTYLKIGGAVINSANRDTVLSRRRIAIITGHHYLQVAMSC